MTPTVILIIVISIALAVSLSYVNIKLIIARRQRSMLLKKIAKEREATAAILNLTHKAIAAGDGEETFLKEFVAYALRAIQGDGAAALGVGDSGRFVGIGVAGSMPPLKEATSQAAEKFFASAERHNEFINGRELGFGVAELNSACGEDGFAFFNRCAPAWSPPDFAKFARRSLWAAIKIDGETAGCVVIISRNDFDSHHLREEDGAYLARLTELASLSLDAMRVFRERREYEERLQSAKREGMLQISTGILHNIGNAVTVAKLAVADLRAGLGSGQDRPEDLLLEEILPNIRRRLAAGDLPEFLSTDKVGRQYLDICEELLLHIRGSFAAGKSSAESLADKLTHISEIIELQQRFVGELGTENPVLISSIINSSIKIYEESFNKIGCVINTDFSGEESEVLIDSSMMTQVFMNLLKNAVEAKDADKERLRIDIKVGEENGDNGRRWMVCEVRDNGSGMDDEDLARIFEFGFSTKGNKSSRGFGLHSCRETMQKYGGDIKVESQRGKGTKFTLTLPVMAKS